LAKFPLPCALALSTLVCLTGCHKIIKPKLVCLRTDITPTANQNQPVAVDVLLVRDKDLVKKLMTLSAAAWFDQRAQVERDYPDPKDLVVIHREWVPGQDIPCSNFTLNPKPRATILFANYFTKGDHRARLINGKSVAIHLGDDDFKIVPMAECTRASCPAETAVTQTNP
jgi:type VI secretion system protein